MTHPISATTATVQKPKLKFVFMFTMVETIINSTTLVESATGNNSSTVSGNGPKLTPGTSTVDNITKTALNCPPEDVVIVEATARITTSS